jgi:hypothetical protein
VIASLSGDQAAGLIDGVEALRKSLHAAHRDADRERVYAAAAASGPMSTSDVLAELPW